MIRFFHRHLFSKASIFPTNIVIDHQFSQPYLSTEIWVEVWVEFEFKILSFVLCCRSLISIHCSVQWTWRMLSLSLISFTWGLCWLAWCCRGKLTVLLSWGYCLLLWCYFLTSGFHGFLCVCVCKNDFESFLACCFCQVSVFVAFWGCHSIRQYQKKLSARHLPSSYAMPMWGC